MKRRGFFTKLVLGAAAVPSVAKAAIKTPKPRMDYETDPNITGFGLARTKNEGDPIQIDDWTPSADYEHGDVVIDTSGALYRALPALNMGHPPLTTPHVWQPI